MICGVPETGTHSHHVTISQSSHESGNRRRQGVLIPVAWTPIHTQDVELSQPTDLRYIVQLSRVT